jgi:flavin reductase
MTAELAAAFRDGMANLGAAVNVVTSDGAAGRVGFTATAVCSVSDAPPMLAICMNRRSAQNAVVKANGVLCVNTLAAEQQELSAVFSGRTDARADERFAKARWVSLKSGAPVLLGALSSFDCEVNKILEVGSHSIFICEVVDIASRTGAGLVYYRRTYHALPGDLEDTLTR